MIDEAAKLVAKKTGLSMVKSRQAVEVVLELIKKKMPAMASQIDALAGMGGGLGSAENLAKSLLGGKK